MAEDHGLGDILYVQGILKQGEFLRSRNGRFSLIMQSDGNLVSYKPPDATSNGHAIALFASSNTWRQGDQAVLQSDGRLVVQDKVAKALWSSRSTALPTDKYRLIVQNDGNTVIYSSGDVPVWSNHVSSKAFDS